MGDIHELFVLALSLVWFAGATPELSGASLPLKFREFGLTGPLIYGTFPLLYMGRYLV